MNRFIRIGGGLLLACALSVGMVALPVGAAERNSPLSMAVHTPSRSRALDVSSAVQFLAQNGITSFATYQNYLLQNGISDTQLQSYVNTAGITDGTSAEAYLIANFGSVDDQSHSFLGWAVAVVGAAVAVVATVGTIVTLPAWVITGTVVAGGFLAGWAIGVCTRKC